jgi:DNA-binding CsgD family transcriptional regulator
VAADQRANKFDSVVERNAPTLQLAAILFHRAACGILEPQRSIDGVVLSPREYECLMWSARGKTAWEIGVILGISRRTVVYHLENAKQKLGVHSIAAAVARFAAGKVSNF